ncbi:hypothetical protein BC939DRAFT_436920 [Gamsiella multidivaricata]|uniref:uncharacterized protein n=1 Tax=Gamsiella multidivaricata TaxID=101098 RepID=UPI00221F5ACF|nr:uncharacterized protein BC939DRAFT_436920 [Gamsiella multidivaricata]KAI7831394.1 hypothetical protein BC939DRAFT_436920 [Gamsiella multidivaricata]
MTAFVENKDTEAIYRKRRRHVRRLQPCPFKDTAVGTSIASQRNEDHVKNFNREKAPSSCPGTDAPS